MLSFVVFAASAPRVTNGWELIQCRQLKATLPTGIPSLEQLMVFRFGGKG